MGFLDLFVVAVVPVLKVLLITLVGLFLALDRIDLLGSTARPYLNNVSSIHVYRILCFIEFSAFLLTITGKFSAFVQLIFYVFSPALVSSQLAGTITLQSLATL